MLDLASASKATGLTADKAAVLAAKAVEVVAAQLKKTDGKALLAVATKVARKNPIVLGAALAGAGLLFLMSKRAAAPAVV